MTILARPGPRIRPMSTQHGPLGRARRSGPSLRRNVLLGLLLLGVGCRATPRTSDWIEARDLGFREPTGTFQRFRTAFCADAPLLEYRCLSQGFLDDNQIEGQFVYREFRERLVESEPFLRYALAEARVQSVEYTDPRSATLVARTLGRTLRVRFVREDFWEISDDEGPWEGDFLPDLGDVASLQTLPNGDPVLEILLPLEDPEVAGSLRELRVASEWKIRGLELVEGSRESPSD